MATANRAARRAGAAAALDKGGPKPFDADSRRTERETATVKIEGVTFTRRRKDWSTTRAQRKVSRVQESAIALSARLRVRIAELEAEQVEEAAKGNDEAVATLEDQLDELVTKADDAIEDAELVTYRLLALLLRPPTPADGEDELAGFGPDADNPEEPRSIEDAEPALDFLKDALDVEDAAALARELTGSAEADPPTVPSTETGGS